MLLCTLTQIYKHIQTCYTQVLHIILHKLQILTYQLMANKRMVFKCSIKTYLPFFLEIPSKLVYTNHTCSRFRLSS